MDAICAMFAKNEKRGVAWCRRHQFTSVQKAESDKLLEALSKTLAQLPHVQDAPNARMADFAHFGIAVQRAPNWPEGSVKKAYVQNQREQMCSSLDDDSLANVVRKLANDLEQVQENANHHWLAFSCPVYFRYRH